MIRPLKEMRIILSVSILLFLGSLVLAVYSEVYSFLGFSVFLLVWIAFVFCFARNPHRQIPEGDRLILAPADGRIQSIRTREKIRIHVFLSFFDVHVNRIPMSGSIRDVVYKKGMFFPANTSHAMKRNERNTIKLETTYGLIQFSQIAGLIARRIVCSLNQGEKVHAGDVFGMIKFGSGVELILPPSVRLKVKKGDRIRAGETIIGEFA